MAPGRVYRIPLENRAGHIPICIAGSVPLHQPKSKAQKQNHYNDCKYDQRIFLHFDFTYNNILNFTLFVAQTRRNRGDGSAFLFDQPISAGFPTSSDSPD